MPCMLYTIILLLLNRISAGDDDDCWIGSFTQERCCSGKAGDSSCWDDKLYTYARCCHPSPKQQVRAKQSDNEKIRAIKRAFDNSQSERQSSLPRSRDNDLFKSLGGVVFNDQLHGLAQ